MPSTGIRSGEPIRESADIAGRTGKGCWHAAIDVDQARTLACLPFDRVGLSPWHFSTREAILDRRMTTNLRFGTLVAIAGDNDSSLSLFTTSFNDMVYDGLPIRPTDPDFRERTCRTDSTSRPKGAQVQSRRMEVIANNIANVDTVGFKRDLAVMQSRYAEAIQRGTASPGARDDQRCRRRRAVSRDGDRFLPRTAEKDRKSHRRGPAGRRLLRRPERPGTAAHAGRQFSPHGRRRPGDAAGIPGSRRGQLADRASVPRGALGKSIPRAA